MSKIKKTDLLALLQEQAEMIVELSSMIKMNKQSIIKLENEREQPKPKQLDQSVFDGLDEKWRFAAVDRDGAVFVFVKRPDLHCTFWGNADSTQFSRKSAKGAYDKTDWQNSLIERDKVELTGSDLARAMLARGDKYVSGFGHHKSDDGAVYSTFADTVTRYNHCFHSAQNSWDYFVPINNQGEPLTATDVGL